MRARKVRSPAAFDTSFTRILVPSDLMENHSRLAFAAKLTHREHEILSLVSKGSVDKEIAEALGISV